MKKERVTIFAGHYGAGKTNIAVNYAIYLKKDIKNVTLLDLDIVNPYFRAGAGADVLSRYGVNLITPLYAGTNIELPSIPEQAVSVFDNKDLYAVIDLGGDDAGAYAIGRYKERIANEKSINILFVINCYRPLSRDIYDIIEIKEAIEQAAGFRFNGIINNSNLGNETTAADALKTLDVINEVSRLTALPVVMTCARAGIVDELKNRLPNVFGLELI